MTGAVDPRDVLPTVIHHPLRLAVLSSLRHVEAADFVSLRDAFATTSAEMSRQLGILESAGLVEVLKSRKDRQVVTQARLSDHGRTAFATYLEELRRISEGLG